MELIIAALFVLFLFREILHFIERRDMLNRLMAKDLTDYKVATDKPEANEEVVDDGMMPIEEAEQELNGEEE